MPARPAFKPEERLAFIPRRAEVARKAAFAQKETERKVFETFNGSKDLVFAKPLETNFKGVAKSDLGNTLNNLSRGLFKEAEVRYSHDEKTKVYSVRATLNERPVVLTLQIGPNFTQISLKDSKKEEILQEINGKYDFNIKRRPV